MIKFCRKMWSTNVISWYKTLVLFVMFALTACSASDECEKINPCRCRFPNGSVIDIQSLGMHEAARFQEIKLREMSNFSYYYNPCFNFRLPENAPVAPTSQCADGVAACEVSKEPIPNESHVSYISLGSQESVKFWWNQQNHRVHLIYSTCTHERSANITLVCNANPLANDTLVVERRRNGSNSVIVEMTLTSRCACPDLCGGYSGLSAGSILIILFSVFVVLYLLLGMVFNKLTRGAQGWELIPNYEFWQDFPLLVRDGCVYVATGCKPDTTYERI